VEYPERALQRVRGHIEAICAVEKLDAHARSVSIRFDKDKS
jgi:histidinol dehydrogenase